MRWEAFKSLESLDITRCVKLSDDGLLHVTRNCQSLRRLNVYAVSVFTDRSLETIGGLCNLTFLDLCGEFQCTVPRLTVGAGMLTLTPPPLAHRSPPPDRSGSGGRLAVPGSDLFKFDLVR